MEFDKHMSHSNDETNLSWDFSVFQTSTAMDPHCPLSAEETSIARAPSKRHSSRPVMASLNVSKTCTAVPEIPAQESLSRRTRRKDKLLNKCHSEIQWTTVKQIKTTKTYSLRSGEALAWQRKQHKGTEDNVSGLNSREIAGETTLTPQRKEHVKGGRKKRKGTHGPLQSDGFDPSLACSDPDAAKSSEEPCENIRNSRLDSDMAGEAAPLLCVKALNNTAAVCLAEFELTDKCDKRETGEQKLIFSKQAMKRRQADIQEVALTQPEGNTLVLDVQLLPDMGCYKSTKHDSSTKRAKGQNNKVISDTPTTLNATRIMEWSPCNTRAVKNNVRTMSIQKARTHDTYIALDSLTPNLVKAATMKSKTGCSSAKKKCISVTVSALSVFPKIASDKVAIGVPSNPRKSEVIEVPNVHLLENRESLVLIATENFAECGDHEQVPVQKLDSPQQDQGITGVNEMLEAKNLIPISADNVKHIICEINADEQRTKHGHGLFSTCSESAEPAEHPFKSNNDERLSISHLGSNSTQNAMTEQTLTPEPVTPSIDHSSAVYLKSCNGTAMRSAEQVNSRGFVVLPDCGKWGLRAAQHIQCKNGTRSRIVPLESSSVEAVRMEHKLTPDPCAPSTDCTSATYQQNTGNKTTSNVSDDDKNQALLSGKHYNSDYYIEETAWRYFGDAAPASYCLDEGGDLLPLLPPAPLSKFPQTGHCTWTFDEHSRVVLGSFQNEGETVIVDDEDREFLFDMMERNDITVITEGHANGLNHDVWSLAFIKARVGTDYHHKFRRFIRRLPSTETPCQSPLYEEVDGYLTMKVADYIEYLLRRSAAMLKSTSGVFIDNALDFVYTDADGEEMKLHLLNDVVYMIDYDIIRMLPELYEDLVSNLKIPECLPGGQKCMMNAVNQNGRPFMGPNLYMTPGGSFTAVHQDGFGTVDSGHLCLSGFNEVVMLRRLPENHKANAVRLLFGETKYDPLHELPHGDFLVRQGEKPTWPTNFGIEFCKKMNYCPSVFVLRPGQQVHINKSRLHAFRKLTPDAVDSSDCHKELRLHIVKNETIETLHSLCISIAWDWMYLGNSCAGVNREIVSILECAAINRVLGKMSLAIPELCILALARKHMSHFRSKIPFSPSFLPSTRKSMSNQNDTDQKVLAGILPVLQFMIGQHVDTAHKATTEKGVNIAKRPNSWENPQLFALDPYGNTDFFCKICFCELSNIYMHCDGCENLLFKDFNICVTCHAEKKFVAKIAMHPYKPERRHCSVNHVGDNTRDNQKRCPCKNGPQCTICHFCLGCSCRCHRSFTMHQRLLNSHDEHEVLGWVTSIVNDNILPYTEEVAPRLLAATQSAFNTIGAPSRPH